MHIAQAGKSQHGAGCGSVAIRFEEDEAIVASQGPELMGDFHAGFLCRCLKGAGPVAGLAQVLQALGRKCNQCKVGGHKLNAFNE